MTPESPYLDCLQPLQAGTWAEPTVEVFAIIGSGWLPSCLKGRGNGGKKSSYYMQLKEKKSNGVKKNGFLGGGEKVMEGRF